MTSNAFASPCQAPDLCFLTVAEASRRIRAGSLSPVDLTRAYLDRIASLNDVLHAYIEVFEPSAMAAARKAEAEIRAGHWRGPLHGIGVALKDNIYAMEGPTTCHSRLLPDHARGEDAAVTRRLRAAGAVILGKLSMWEFATGGIADSDIHPAARNPWNLDRSANGSSSGSAVAVAAGLCALALGTDTGGSIRNPAAWCGIAALKPTYDLVDREGVFPVSWSLDHVGPMAWTSQDCALALGALAGSPLSPANESPRVGIVRHYFRDGAGVSPEIGRVLDRVEATLAEQGVETRDVTLPPMRLYQDVGLQIARTEAFAVHEADLRERPELYGAAARQRLLMGAVVRGADYVNAQRERRRLTLETERAMQDVDLLVLPSIRHGACAFGEDVLGAKGAFFGRPFNVTGQPAAAVPAGFDAHGMPLSIQIAGRAHDDLSVLALGDRLETALGQRSCRPMEQSASALMEKTA